jgi:hypothetical protein
MLLQQQAADVINGGTVSATEGRQLLPALSALGRSLTASMSADNLVVAQEINDFVTAASNSLKTGVPMDAAGFQQYLQLAADLAVVTDAPLDTFQSLISTPDPNAPDPAAPVA